MPRDKIDKKDKLPYATDLAEHCHQEADCFQNQFTKLSHKKAEERVMELNKGKLPSPHSILLYIDDGTGVYYSDFSLLGVLTLINDWITEEAHNNNSFRISNSYQGEIGFKIVDSDSWEINLVINKNKEIFSQIRFDNVNSDMVKILVVNFFNGNFEGKKYNSRELDEREIRELQTKFRTVQKELLKSGLNCSYCFSAIIDLIEIKCQYCGNEFDVFRKVLEIFD